MGCWCRLRATAVLVMASRTTGQCCVLDTTHQPRVRHPGSCWKIPAHSAWPGVCNRWALQVAPCGAFRLARSHRCHFPTGRPPAFKTAPRLRTSLKAWVRNGFFNSLLATRPFSAYCQSRHVAYGVGAMRRRGNHLHDIFRNLRPEPMATPYDSPVRVIRAAGLAPKAVPAALSRNMVPASGYASRGPC